MLATLARTVLIRPEDDNDDAADTGAGGDVGAVDSMLLVRCATRALRRATRSSMAMGRQSATFND